MSSYTGVVTARDLLTWALEQGIFTRDVKTDGPWEEVVSSLITAAGEGLVTTGTPIYRQRGGALEWFEEYVAAHCLDGIVAAFALSDRQVDVVMQLAQELRLFFDASTVTIDDSGLDGPLHGDLLYQCTSDFDIQIPPWAAARAQAR